MSGPPRKTIAALIAEYEVFLMDAYGVLVDQGGAIHGARELIEAITAAGRRFLVVTNDASRLPGTCARRFQGFGLPIAAEQVITAGSLLTPYFAQHGLRGARCAVLGPEDSKAYVRAAGGKVVPVSVDEECDALIVCDESGYPFLDTVDEALSMLYRHFDRGRPVSLILPNPDLIYPKGPRGNGDYGFTSGAAAMLLEAGLGRRYRKRKLEFVRLGKPHGPLFAEARRRAASQRLIMIGDQIETDIAGANAAGIDSALVTTGVSQWDELADTVSKDETPTFLLMRA